MNCQYAKLFRLIICFITFYANSYSQNSHCSNVFNGPYANEDSIKPNLQKQSTTYLYKGIQFFESGSINKAQQDFIKSLTYTWQFNFPAYNNYAVTSAIEGHFNQSLNLFAKSNQRNIDTINYNIALVNINTEHFDLAKNYFEKISNLGLSQSMCCLYNEGFTCSKLNLHYDAIRLYSDVLDMDSLNSVALFNRATEYLAVNCPKEALKDYLTGAQYSKGNLLADNYLGAGIIYYKLKKFDLAYNDLSKSYNINSEDSRCLESLCFALIEEGKCNEAKERLKFIQLHSGDHKLIYTGLGYVYYKEEQWDSSQCYFDKALSIDKNYIMAIIGKGNLLCSLKKFYEAHNCFNKVLSIDNNNIPAHIGNAMVYFMEKNYYQTKIEFGLCDEIDSTYTYNYYTYYLRGMTCYYLNDFDNANRNFKMCELHSDGSEVFWIIKGTIEYQLCNYKSARESFSKAIQINPENDETHVDRGNVLIEQHRFVRAKRDYKTAIRINKNNANAFNGLSLSIVLKYANPNAAMPRKNFFPNAIRYMDSALNKSHNAVYLYNNRGLSESYCAKYFQERNKIDTANYYYNLAAKDYEIALLNGFTPSELNLINLKLEDGKYDSAIIDYSKCTFKQVALNNTGVAYAREQEYSKAYDFFTNAIKLDNKSISIYAEYNRQNLYSQNHKLQAIYFYRHLISNIPASHPIDLGLLPIVLGFQRQVNDYLIMKQSIFNSPMPKFKYKPSDLRAQKITNKVLGIFN